MLRLSDAAANLIINIMVQQGLDPLRDVCEIAENEEGFAISFTRDLAPTEVVSGLRVFYRGSPLGINLAEGVKRGLVFTNGWYVSEVLRRYALVH
jgi:hypothetical protein